MTATNGTSRCSCTSGSPAARAVSTSAAGSRVKRGPSSTTSAAMPRSASVRTNARCSAGRVPRPYPVVSSSSPPLSSEAMLGTSPACTQRTVRCMRSAPARISGRPLRSPGSSRARRTVIPAPCVSNPLFVPLSMGRTLPGATHPGHPPGSSARDIHPGRPPGTSTRVVRPASRGPAGARWPGHPAWAPSTWPPHVRTPTPSTSPCGWRDGRTGRDTARCGWGRGRPGTPSCSPRPPERARGGSRSPPGPIGGPDTVRARMDAYAETGPDEPAPVPATAGDPVGDRTPPAPAP